MPVPSNTQDLINIIREKLFNNTSGLIEEPDVREVLENIVKVLDAKFSMFSPNLTEEQFAQWNLILDYMAKETKGVLTTSSPAPTGNAAIGKYLLSGAGTYANLGGLVAAADKLNYAYFDGENWSLISSQAFINYNVDPEKIVPTEAQYTNDTIAADLAKRVDLQTKTNVNLQKISSGTVDNVLIFQDTSGQKYKRVYEGLPLLRWWGTTDVAESSNATKLVSALNSVAELKIDFDIDLNGQTVILPANKRIHFEKGIIKNGTIQGNNTRFTGDIKFSGCSFTGTFDLREVKTEYFKETTDDLVFEKGLQFAGLNTNKTLTVSRRNYTIANPINLRNCSLIGEDLNINANLVSISYSGNVAAITINAISTYALEGFRIENLILKYTGLNTNRVPAILNNSQLTKGNYIRNIVASNFTSYVFTQNKNNYIQEAHFENIRGVFCGGLIGYNSTPTTQFPWNIVSIVNSSIDGGLNAYMVEPICIDMLGASTVNLKGIVLQGSKGAMVADTVDGSSKTVYGFTAFRAGWLGISINHKIELDGLWLEFTNSETSKKAISISGKGGSFNFKKINGCDNLLIENSVLAADINLENDWVKDYNAFIDNRSQYAGININLKLFSDVTNGQLFTEKGDLYKMTKDDVLTVTRKSYFANQIDMPFADLKNLSISKYYGATNGAVYAGNTQLLTGSLAKEGSIFFTRYLMNSNGNKRVSFNVPIVSNYTPRVIIVVKMRISLPDADTTSNNQVVQVNNANALNYTSRPAHQLGGVKSWTLNQTTRTTGWITIAYMVNNHNDERVFGISKSQIDDVVVDVSHVYICKGNQSFIDRDFIETNHSFLEVADAALSNITSYVSATEVLVKNKNTFKVLKNGVLKGIGEIFPQAFTTATRPTASSVGAGAMIFDTTLNKPIWSDGTNWKDASGTTV